MGTITVRVIDGADRGRVYRDLGTPVSVGREEGNSIQLNDERISRFHLKIQEDGDRYILTDLESTNGSKVNGEDIHLRVLQFGDIVALGRSLLLFGSEDQIRQRLEEVRRDDPDGSATLGLQEIVRTDGDPEQLDLSWHDDVDTQTSLKTIRPPELPQELTPGQAAQLTEVLSYLHARMRKVIQSSTAKGDGAGGDMQLPVFAWQSLLDMHAKLAEYMRKIG